MFSYNLHELPMSESLNIPLTDRLRRFIDERQGPDGLYQDAEEYVRDLIRRDYEAEQAQRWARLVHELRPGLAASDDDFVEFNTEQLIAEARAERAGDGD